MRVTFDQCNDTEEVCGLFNKVFANQEQMEAKIVQNAQEIEALKPKEEPKPEPKAKPKAKPKSEKKGKSKMKSKKGYAIKKMLVVLLLLAIAGLCYAAYVPTDITYEIASNPEMLATYLRDVTSNMASDAYLFNPRSAPPLAVEGRVYYDSDDFALLLYNGTSWQTVDAAGGMTLNSAYDFGGAGLGANITATDGAVTIQNTEADAASLLALTYNTGAQTGDGITITMGDGSGDGIEFENTGTGFDLHGTGGHFTADLSGNVVCVDLTTSDDVLFAGTTYDVAFDASREALVFEDDAILGFGAGAHDDAPDITFTFESIGSSLDIAGDDLEILIGTAGAGLNVIFSSEEVAEYATFAEEAAELLLTHYDIQFDDDADLIVGTDNDWVIECDGADILEILTKLTDGTAAINLGVDGAGADLKMFSEVAANYVEFDSTADEVYHEDCDLKLNEGAQLEFCYDDNATDWSVDLATANRLLFTCAETDETPNIHIGVASAGADLKIFGTDAGDYWEWDASADLQTIVGDAVAWTLTEAAATAVNIDITGAAGGFDLDTTDGNIVLTTGGVARTLQLHSDDGTAQDSIYLLSDVGGVRITTSAVPDHQYGLEVASAIATNTDSQGSAAYFHTTITGNIDAPTYNLGSWLDVTGGTPTAGLLAAIDCGIYADNAPDLSNIWVVGLQIQTMIDNATTPAYHAMMRFNTNQAGDTPDVWFQAANPDCVAFTANTLHGASATDKIGAIKIAIVGYGDCYFYIYSSAGT